ncbi:MAG: chromate efflux transporter [Hoeflea sp.]|uniref:chromate efflux transporter n=1 Tax=Hoeflea sp. TaxID=1940281 RepID=UPI001DA15B98|nr:chromate efflux transporter [Hoeflea sp.]MBU4527232.1 chromate efflux transporter [Alphaproteobacteria bacterium]MBU4546985.1 chromate efflux transporter [Alphaproteobacteria bacterium]MBU4551503.1 chromate efflux transporter [Alphaproteobacteria bacterium]MBV1725508.1 chromate efflux transporter [Hoeflea sp.]MBV1759556.1 chromate efflux transporter [Hoeflea sp.]
MTSTISPSWAELFRVFGRIGLLSFGGPAGQIALMHRELVEERAWLDEPRFLHALNFCMLLPGPEAMQLATYSGWLLRGVAGGLLAGLLFILPGFAVIMTLSAVYFHYGDLPVVAGVLFGLKAAVLAIVVEALLRVSKRALKSRLAWGLAVAAFIAIAFLKLPFPLIVLGAGLIGVLVSATGTADLSAPAPAPEAEEAGADRLPGLTGPTLRTIGIWGAVWLVPLAILVMVPAVPDALAAMALFFSKAAIVTFGGAYAVLAYVGQQAVEVHGWLMPGDMLAGLGLAESTPGPLILVLVFVGFLGGAREAGLDPLTGGMLGGSVALFFTFAPCFLWIFAGAPHIERLRSVKWLSAGLAAITAAVVGVISNLAVWFALHVLFADVGEAAFGPFSLPVPDLATLNVAALAIALGAGVALLRYHLNLFLVLGGATLAGIAVTVLA